MSRLAYDLTDTAVFTLGEGTASYPVLCPVPKALAVVFAEVVVAATATIAADLAYVTTRPQFRFVYDAFAQATQVDRFTQFWRTLNYNFQQFLVQDPYVVGFVASYAASLDAAIDPLGNDVDYLQIQADALTRNRSWSPGQPLLSLPIPPVVSVGTLPGLAGTTNGWSGSDFDPQAFLSRPDIQSLPLPVQYTMLRTNESYAALMTTAGNVRDTTVGRDCAREGRFGFDTKQRLQRGLDSAIGRGLEYDPAPGRLCPDQIRQYQLCDFADPVHCPSQWTLHDKRYPDMGPRPDGIANCDACPEQHHRPRRGAGPRTLHPEFQHHPTVEYRRHPASRGPAGDRTGHGYLSQRSAVRLTSAVIRRGAAAGERGPVLPSGTAAYVADASLGAGTAVQIQAGGGVLAVDPVNAPDSAIPLVDGIIIEAVQSGGIATVGTKYGTLYAIENANFVVGGLVFAGPGGLLTQDFSSLVTQVNWVIAVGRAVQSDMLLFEPQIPTKTILSY